MTDVPLSFPPPARAGDDLDTLDVDGKGPDDGVGLCLSGGGYRAMLFHVGGLRRLNETGWLHQVTRVSSVSGGSIVAGLLGVVWRDLAFGPDGVADRFDELVERPVIDLAGHTIDVWSVLTGLWPGRIARKVSARYDRYLFHGATLQDLPDDEHGPRFIFCATNLSNGALWRFSKPYMRDWRTPAIDHPRLLLADAVAASSAFPPFLSPSLLTPTGTDTEFTLTDGGVYDNLGLEPVVKNCHTVLVSDGGGTFGEPKEPHRDWVRGTLRVLQTIDVEVRRLRRRQVVGLLASHRRNGGFWAINTDRAEFPAEAGTLPCPHDKTMVLARTPTRLARTDLVLRRRLVNWGYAATDACLRSYVDTTLKPPTGFPYPREGLG